MTRFWSFVLVWAAAILGFDAVASLASRWGGIEYAWFSIGSLAIYFTAGSVGAPRFGLQKAVLATILVATCEGTLGWAISWMIGPGSMEVGEFTVAAVILSGIVSAVVLGGVCGLLGGLLGVKRAPSTRTQGPWTPPSDGASETSATNPPSGG